jgi:phenylpropionate dioxygenase-like ring-hydroxylating dioxygenase large terminal subunit
MKTEEQIRLIELLMTRLDEGVNVDAGGLRQNPAEVYSCPELAAREWQSFFRTHPQVIGMSADLAEPGSFLTCSDFGVPVLATRDKTGEFRAFVNVCRHRGVKLVDEAAGQRSHFSCPFHGWTYSNQGGLVSIPKEGHFGQIDKSCHGLVPLPAVERYGLLWVHPRPDGEIDVDALLGGLAEEFDTWRFDRLQNVGYDSYEKRMNWKLGIDTFGETYHFTTLHRNTLAPNFHGNVQTYDTFGRNHRMGLCYKSIDELRAEPREKWHISRAALPVYYLFPNVQLNVLSRSVVLVRLYPDPEDPARSLARLSFYATAEALDTEPGLVEMIVQGFSDVIRDEDFEVAARSQLGSDCGIPEHVIFGRNEPALHHYHNTYREALGMPELPLIEG